METDTNKRMYRTAVFQKEFRKNVQDTTKLKGNFKYKLKRVLPTVKRPSKDDIRKYLPFLNIWTEYNIRRNLPSDLAAGFTVGIMHLPQGMAYAMLAGLPTYVGLYTSLFPVIIYFFMGTSKHISMGTGALVSLMLGGMVSQYQQSIQDQTIQPQNITMNNTMIEQGVADSIVETKTIVFVCAISFLAGIVHIVFGLLRLGNIAAYISHPLTSGFTTAAAIYIAIVQIKHLLGIKTPSYSGNLQVIFTTIAVMKNIGSTNLATLIVSAICLVVLYVVKVHINMRFKDRMKIAIPIDFIVLVIATLTSYFIDIRSKYAVKVIGNIPTGVKTDSQIKLNNYMCKIGNTYTESNYGDNLILLEILPPPFVPNLGLIWSYTGDIIVLAIVVFAQTISIEKFLAKKHGYQIDANQELLAYGFGNCFGSFFSCMPSGGSLSRTLVQESLGHTQITSLFALILVTIIILFAGTLLESLPTCVLSVIIIVTLRDMFLQIFQLKKIWNESKYDFSIWIVTFLGVIFSTFDVALWIGLGFSFFTVLMRIQKAKAFPMQKIETLDVYADELKYKNLKNQAGVKVIGFRSPLYFANADLFLQQLQRATGVYLDVSINSAIADTEIQVTNKDSSSRNLKDMLTDNNTQEEDTAVEMSGLCQNLITDVHHIVIDFSSVLFIDTTGAKLLQQIMSDYNQKGITVFLAHVYDDVWDSLDNLGFLKENEDAIFVTLDDAVNAASCSDSVQSDNHC